MKYDHMVKVNGIYYSSGQEVPDGVLKEKETFPFSGSGDDNAKYYSEQPKKQYTKTEISQMKTAELQDLAAKEGIENAHGINGSDLKKILSEHFGL